MTPTREEYFNALKERHGEALHARFSAASAAICGLGGLGSNIAVSLARAGVGRLILIDFDQVDISNLHRQQYKAAQVGLDKTKALSDNLLEIAPYIELETHTVRIVDENDVTRLLSSADIILGSANAIQTRRITDHFYLCGDQSSDTSAGLKLMAPRVMLCAAHQAQTVLRILAYEYDV